MGMQIPRTVSAAAITPHAVAALPAEMYPRKLVRVNLNGPAGSSAELYLGFISPANRFDRTPRGQSNTADYGANPQPIPAGMSISVVWPNMAAQVAVCNATFTTERG